MKEKNTRERPNDPRSLAMLIGSMVIYGTIGVFRRQIDLSSGLIAFLRGAAGAAFLLLFVKLSGRQRSGRMPASSKLRFFLSGAVMGFNWILLFEAYNYTSVAVATLCYYMQPVIVVLASALLFQERLTARKVLCTAAALVGMFFVSGVFDGGMPEMREATGILLGLGAAVLYATVILINKSVRGADAYDKTILQLFSAAVVLIPYLLITERTGFRNLDGRGFLMLAIVCIVHTGFAYALYFGCMDGLRTQTVALFSYIDPVVAIFLSALVLHEKLTGFGIVGAVLILGAAVISELS